MAEVKEHILNTALRLFTSYGIRSITMDDIAKEISISKKTIYQNFKDKDEIVYLCTKQTLEQERTAMLDIQQQSETAIDELLLITDFLRDHMWRINPSAMYDIKKYYYDAWTLYLDFKENVFIESVKSNLLRGMTEGFFRKSLNADILSILRVEQMQLTFDESIFPRNKFSFQEIQLQIFDLFIQGILTPKGREVFQKKSLEKNEVQ